MSSYVLDALSHLSSNPIQSDYKLQLVRGIPQNPLFDAGVFENIIDNFETKDGDIFIATFVKAGTTWTQQIVHLLLRNGVPGGFYSESIPWLESLASDFLGQREAPTWSLAKVNQTPAPRYFKTHATVNHLPRGKAAIKVIYVARNPKDSVVSLYHHAKSKPEFGYTGDFDKFCEIFLAGQAENGSWFDHVLDWNKKCQQEPDTHLFLQYEEMYQNPAVAIQKIASFLNISLTPESLENVVKHSSINEMKTSASIGLNHLRKGGYGGWRTSFTVAMSEFFDDVYKFKMNGSGLKFNFGPNSLGEDIIM
eukprot:gene12375-16599_t